MNIIFVKHDCCEKEFCFEVPENMAKEISKGDILLVNTMKGVDIATAITGVVSGDGVLDVATNKGAYLPLKSVISFANIQMINYISRKNSREIIERIMANMPENEQNLPF